MRFWYHGCGALNTLFSFTCIHDFLCGYCCCVYNACRLALYHSAYTFLRTIDYRYAWGIAAGRLIDHSAVRWVEVSAIEGRGRTVSPPVSLRSGRDAFAEISRLGTDRYIC